MKLNNVLVAGHKGFIGSNLWKRKGANWIGSDLKDGYDIWDAKIDENCEVIVLLAAKLDQTIDMYRHNLRIYYWLTMLKDMAPKAHVIYTSSAAVYADSSQPVTEDIGVDPPSIYGKSKLLGEGILKDVVDSYTILRLSNVYGDGGDGVIDRFKKGQNIIYGDGENIRDYISVDKVCGVVEKILKNPEKYKNKTYNISTGKGLTVNDVFKKYGKGESRNLKARDFDVKFSVLDNSKAKKEGLL